MLSQRKNSCGFYMLLLCLLLTVILAFETTSFAATNVLVNLDDKITNSAGVLSQGDGSIAVTQYAATTKLTCTPTTATTYTGFDVSFPVYSAYKTFLLTKKPDTFAASGKQLCTVIEAKFKLSLEDPSVPNKPTANYHLTYKLGTTSGSIEGLEPNITPDGETWITLKYVFNPITKIAKVYKNDVKIKEVTVADLGTKDFTEIRFYQRAYPELVDGKYPTPSGTLNTTTDDGVIKLCTPVIFSFDYYKIYQITPYNVETSDPANNSTNVSETGPYSITFDTNMDPATLNGGSIQLNLDNNDGIVEGMPITAFPNGAKSCMIIPLGNLEFYSRYKISILPAVKDENSFYRENISNIYFTTKKRNISEDIYFTDLTSPMSLKCNGQPTATLKAGEISGVLSLTNSQSSSKSVRIVTALYAKDAVSGLYGFRDSKTTTATLQPGQNSVATKALTVPNEQDCFIKVFVWDENGYPFSDSIRCDMGGSVVLSD